MAKPKNGKGRRRGKAADDRSVGVDGAPVEGEGANTELPVIVNAAERAQYIRDQKIHITTLTAEKDKLKVEVKEKSDLITAAYRAMKSRLGYSREDAELAFDMLSIGEDNRNETFDTIHEVFAAHGVALDIDQLDILDRIEKKAGAQKARDADWGEGQPAGTA